MSDTRLPLCIVCGNVVLTREQLAAFEREREQLRDALLDVVHQACGGSSDGRLNSMAIRAYADALRLLADCGLVTIEDERGRCVIARG